MFDWLMPILSLFSHRAYLLRRLSRYALAEALCVLGNISPRGLAVLAWRASVWLNPLHVMAALNRALALQDSHDHAAWTAFEQTLQAIENRCEISASDLALTWVPGRLLRRFSARLLWGPTGADWMQAHDGALQAALARLARGHFDARAKRAEFGEAETAWRVWRSVSGQTLEVRWARAELDWARGDHEALKGSAGRLVRAGAFLSPSDPILWGERFLPSSSTVTPSPDDLVFATDCARWAREWLPDDDRVWRLLGRIARGNGERAEAIHCLERALRLNPENVPTLLDLLALDRDQQEPWAQAGGVSLRTSGPADLAVGQEAVVECALEGAVAEWEIYALPPTGRGLVPEPRRQVYHPPSINVTLRACRPDRIAGGPWKLTLVAVSGSRYTSACIEVSVPDREPGRLLVTCTEDHEIQEERGTLPIEELDGLLIEKSAFAGKHFTPWTHMIEVGSALLMPEWSEQIDPAWRRLRERVRDHLADQVAAGNDIQPHYHAFNDPLAPHFPYALTGDAWSPDDRFLLTAEERRCDWANACRPPNWAEFEAGVLWPGMDRVRSAERVAAKIEELGRLGDPDYRAVLWRSGQLELGSTSAERAWSAVALTRAGLLADSDFKPGRSHSSPAAAFSASPEDPFMSRPGGMLLQLPIWGNLEGDFVSGARELAARVKRTTAGLKDKQGQVLPGIHLLTLLTHDKFINARRGGDDTRLDASYGDWTVIREHLQAWESAGAERVTARQGVAAVLDHLTARPVAILGSETFIACDAHHSVRYSVQLLGASIPVSEDNPHDLLVRIPPFLRGNVKGIRAVQGGRELPVEREGETSFWLGITARGPEIRCHFELAEPAGPRVDSLEKVGQRQFRITVSAPDRFLRARMLLPRDLFGGLSVREGEAAEQGAGTRVAQDEDGWLLHLPPFVRAADGAIARQTLEVRL